MMCCYTENYHIVIVIYLSERTVIKEVHSSTSRIVQILFSHSAWEEARLQQDGDRQSETRQEASTLQSLNRPAHHQGSTWGVRLDWRQKERYFKVMVNRF